MYLFLLTLLLAWLVKLVSDEPKVFGSRFPVRAVVGEDVILPCRLEPRFDVHDLTVEWKRNKTIVHTYRSRADYLDDQDKSFKNRTYFFHDEMVNGNISLKLFNVTKQDEGIYTCFVNKLKSHVKEGNVTLEVESKGKEEIKDGPTSGPGTEGNNLSTGAISGIAVGVIAFIAIIAIIAIVFFIKRQRGGQEQNPDNLPEMEPFQ